MAQAWFWTRDGQERNGPITRAELLALVRAGKLAPTDMVWTEGMPDWTPASQTKGLKELFANLGPDAAASPENRPPLRRAPERGVTMTVVLSRLTLAITVIVAVTGMTLALLGAGTATLRAILTMSAIAVGALGVLLGLFVFVLAILTGRSRTFYETAALAIFQGITAVSFAVGSLLAVQGVQEYHEIIGQAGQVQHDRDEAKRLRAEAETVRAEAVEEPTRILKKAEDAAKRQEDALAQLKAEQANLDKARAAAEEDAKTKRAALALLHTSVEKEQTELTNKREAFNKQAAELTRQGQDIEKKANQLKLDLLKPQALKDEAERLRQEADKKQAEAKTVLEEADQKDKEAKVHYKKVVDEIRGVLKPKTKTAVSKVEQLVSLPRPAGLDLSDVNYDLCDLAVKDVKLRDDAINALFKSDRQLAELVNLMLKPPDNTPFSQFVQTVKELPKYRSGGLPIIDGILSKDSIVKNADYGYWHLFQASIDALGETAKQDERALAMLLKAPKGAYAQKLQEKYKLHNFMFAMNVENPFDGAPSQWLYPRRAVAKQLLDLYKENADLAKKREIVDFYIDLLKEVQSDTVHAKLTDDNQMLAASALASFGSDAKRALTALRALRTDNSLEVRQAAIDAITRIEAAK